MKEKFLKAKQLIQDGNYKELLRKTVKCFVGKFYNIYVRELLFKKMQKDSRFRVGDSWLQYLDGNLLKGGIINRPVWKYEVDKLKIGDIKYFYCGELVPLSSTLVYDYLVTGNEESYKMHARVRFKNALHLTGEVLSSRVNEDLARFKNTVNIITNKGYDIRSGAIIVNQDNTLLDGVHRLCILLNLFGPEHEISVLRIYYINL